MDNDPRALLARAYDTAKRAAEEVNAAHATYLDKRAHAETAARKYQLMREAYVRDAKTTDIRTPDDPSIRRCRGCSEPLPVPIPIRCTTCGTLTKPAKEKGQSRPCPTCNTPNPTDRDSCYSCYHPM